MSSGRLRRAKIALFTGFTLLMVGFLLSFYSLSLMAPSTGASGTLGPTGTLRLAIEGSHERVYYFINSTGRSGNITLTFYDGEGRSVGGKTLKMGGVEKGSVLLDHRPSYAVANCTECRGVEVRLYYTTFDPAYTATLSIASAAAAIVGLAAASVGVHVYMNEKGLYVDRRKRGRPSGASA